jgi:predicted lipid-binding transport protein (Tim44 family)
LEGTVPLSEHERRQLEQIEAALREGDPRFQTRYAQPTRGCITGAGSSGAALGFLAGVGLLLAGVVVKVILIAVAGFAVMLARSLWAVASYQRMTGSTTGSVPAKDRGSGTREHAAKGRRAGEQAESGPMGRLEERWRRRAGRPLIPGCPLPSRSSRHGGSLAVCSGP